MYFTHTVQLIRLLTLHVIWDVMYFPIWWYSKGLVRMIRASFVWLKMRYEGLALGLWMKNLFVPMFGQYDWQGRLISFFMRVFQILVRSVFLLFFAILSVIFIALWLVLPILLIFLLFESLFI